MRLGRWVKPMPEVIGGMAGGMIPVAGHLPKPGGMLDQGAWLLVASDIFPAADAKLALSQG